MNLHLFSIFLIIFHLSITSAAENDDDTDGLIIPPQLFDADNIDVSIPVRTGTHESDNLSSTILSEVSSHEEINLETNPVTETISSEDNIDTDDTQSITDSLLLVSAKVEVDEQNSTLETTSVVIVRSISHEQIEEEMTRLKDSIRSYDNDKQLKEHPMIAHFSKIAHGYTICCKRYETSGMFNQYKQHMDGHKNPKFSIYNILNECLKNLDHSIALVDEFEECEIAVSDVTKALAIREKYMKDNEKEVDDVFDKYGQYFPLAKKEHTIIDNEDGYVKQYCPNEGVVELMFDFKKLLHCEELIRQHLHSSPDEYNLYTKNHSEHFQDMIFTKWDRMRTMITHLNSQLTLKSDAQVIEIDTMFKTSISYDMSGYRNALEVNGVEIKYPDHPMITYLSKRAHAYSVCCKPYETQEMLKQYFDNFYANHDADNLLNKIIAKCHGKQVRQFTSEFSKKCQNAYNDVIQAANRRQQFVHDHEKQYPHMESDFNELLNLDSILQQRIKSERAYVNEYCPNVDIMELALDISKLIACEESIRYGLSSSPQKYADYERGISGGFRRFVSKQWDILTWHISIYDKHVVSKSTHKLQISTPVNGPIDTPIKKHENTAVPLNEEIESDMITYENALKTLYVKLKYSDHPLIAYLSKRAHAYTVCCKPYETKIMLNLYLDNFYANHDADNLLNKIIDACYSVHLFKFTSKFYKKCQNAYFDFNQAAYQRQQFVFEVEKQYPAMESDFNDTFYMNSTMQEQIKSEKAYVDAYCPNVHIMELVFDISKLVDCEKSIRYDLLASPDKYIEYKQGISNFFRSFIINNWDRLIRYVSIFDTQRVSNERIESDINHIKNRLKTSGYNEVHDHPMIAHFPKLAYAYTICCKTNETPDMLKTYLDNVETYSHKSDILLASILNCSDTVDRIIKNQCSDAYSHLVESREEARRFADEYAKQHPDKPKLEDSIHPEKLNFDNIEAVHKYVKKYCPNDHVIELLFNLEKYFKCEKSIRYGLQSSLNDYQSYATISSEFTNQIDNSWRLMSIDVEPLKKSHSSPNKISQSKNHVAPISSSGSSMHRMIYPYFTLCFMIVILKI